MNIDINIEEKIINLIDPIPFAMMPKSLVIPVIDDVIAFLKLEIDEHNLYEIFYRTNELDTFMNTVFITFYIRKKDQQPFTSREAACFLNYGNGFNSGARLMGLLLGYVE